ncbi:hypothetical protein ACN28I_16090 [Archangium gephyra]|uniref:hypothetical protein n=1 Tax=Archangium gephyra TaxID=48 RepID=UPI003B813F09
MTFVNKFRPVPKPVTAKTTQPQQPSAKPAANTAKPAATPRADTFEPSRKTDPVVLNPAAAAPHTATAATDTPAAAATDTPAAATTPQAQAQQDAARVEQAYARGGATEAAKELETLVADHPGDTAYADALLREAQPTLEKISTELGDRVRDNQDDSGSNKVTRDTLTSLAKVADAAGPEGRAQLGTALAAGLPDQTDLNQFDDVLSDLADAGQGHALSSAILGALVGTKPQAAQELSELAVDQVQEAQDTYADAVQARDEMEARLAEDLAAFGGALTPEQVEAYKAEFRAKHKEVYDAERAASDALASTLETNRPALEKLAVEGNEDAAKALYEGYNELARSTTHADDAIRWVSELLPEARGRERALPGDRRGHLGQSRREARERAARHGGAQRPGGDPRRGLPGHAGRGRAGGLRGPQDTAGAAQGGQGALEGARPGGRVPRRHPDSGGGSQLGQGRPEPARQVGREERLRQGARGGRGGPERLRRSGRLRQRPVPGRHQELGGLRQRRAGAHGRGAQDARERERPGDGRREVRRAGGAGARPGGGRRPVRPGRARHLQ